MKLNNPFNLFYHHRIGAIALSLLALAGCQSEEAEPLPTNGKMLTFSSIVPETKGASIDGDNLITLGDRMHGLFIYDHPPGTTFTPTSTPASYGFNLSSSYNATLDRWEVDPNNAMWPVDGTTLTFATYHPYTHPTTEGGRSFGDAGKETNFGILSTATDPGAPHFRYAAGSDVAGHQDILIGDSDPLERGSLMNRVRPIGDISVPFQFKHVTSSIVFSKEVVSTSGYTLPERFEFDVLNITISGLDNVGDFSHDMEEDVTDPITDPSIPYLLKTPVLWENLSGSESATFELNSMGELVGANQQVEMTTGELYNLTQEGGVIFIPPQSSNTTPSSLKIEVEANLTATIDGETTVYYWESEFNPDSFDFRQGERTRLVITYNYQGPLTGSLTVEGFIEDWNRQNVTVIPYF